MAKRSSLSRRRGMESQGTCRGRVAPGRFPPNQTGTTLDSNQNESCRNTTAFNCLPSLGIDQAACCYSYSYSCSNAFLAFLHSWPCIFHGSSSRTYTYNSSDLTTRSPRRSSFSSRLNQTRYVPVGFLPPYSNAIISRIRSNLSLDMATSPAQGRNWFGQCRPLMAAAEVSLYALESAD